MMWTTSVGRLRAAGYAEGVSYLVLLAIAMPLKYLAGFPQPVTVVGSLHGLFFVLYLWAVAQAALEHRWKLFHVLWALAASVIPFGTFVLDRQLRNQG